MYTKNKAIMKKTLFTLFLSAAALCCAAQKAEYTLFLTSEDCEENIYINIGDPTALDEIAPNLKVYPNPATDILNVPTLASDISVRLLDGSGKLLQQQKVGGNTSPCRLFIGDYPAGVYFVQVVGTKKTIYKIVKK
jgi:hypothetical protein